MIEVSETAEVSSQPTKRGRKAWLIVVAVVTIVLLANAPKSEPVKVWFVRATNEGGEKKLVFEGTNGCSGRIIFSAYVVPGAPPHGTAPVFLVVADNSIFTHASARATFSFTLRAPANDVSYYVAWEYRDIVSHFSRWNSFRRECHNFFLRQGMDRAAKHFTSPTEPHYILSTEIKE